MIPIPLQPPPVEGVLEILQNNVNLLEEYEWHPSLDEEATTKWWGSLTSADEILVSAILVQQTRWETVRTTVEELKLAGFSTMESISKLPLSQLENLLRRVNFHKTKARRLKKIAAAVKKIDGVEELLVMENRDRFLELEGIGRESADSLLLFAGNQLVIPESEYMKRVLRRVVGRDELVEHWKYSLPRNLYSYKLFYAGISTVGKAYCHRTSPNCASCILKEICQYCRHVQSNSSYETRVHSSATGSRSGSANGEPGKSGD